MDKPSPLQERPGIKVTKTRMVGRKTVDGLASLVVNWDILYGGPLILMFCHRHIYD